MMKFPPPIEHNISGYQRKMNIDLSLVKERLLPVAGNIQPGSIPSELRQVVKFLAKAVLRSHSDGLPYPIAFRNINAIQTLDLIAEYFPAVRTQLAKIKASHSHFFHACRLMTNVLVVLSGEVGKPAEDLRTKIAPRLAVNLLYRERQGTIIEITDAFDELLCASDLDADIPMRLLALPFAAQYVRIGKFSSHRMGMLHPQRGIMRPDGAFCIATRSKEGGHLLAFYRTLIAVDGKSETFSCFQQLITDPNQSLKEWLESLPEAFPDKNISAEDIKETLEWITYIAKVFLYLGMKDARIQKQHDYSELFARLDRVESRKRDKLERRLPRTYDRIIVGPEKLPKELQTTAGNLLSVSPHWRRGHFRMQPYGPGNLQRKLIFITPTLVAAKRLAEQQVHAPKNYVIRDLKKGGG